MLWLAPQGLAVDEAQLRARAGAVEAPPPPEADWVQLWRSYKRSPSSFPYLIGWATGSWTHPTSGTGNEELARRTGLPVEVVGSFCSEDQWTWEDVCGPLDTDAPDQPPAFWFKSNAWKDLTHPHFVGLPGIWVSVPCYPRMLSNEREKASVNPARPWKNPTLWQHSAAGEYDRYHRLVARRLAYALLQAGRRPQLTLLDIVPECTGFWKTWSVGPDVENFKIAYRRLVDIFREEFLRIAGEVPVLSWRPSHVTDFGPNAVDLGLVRRNPPRLWEAFPGEDWADATSTGLHNWEHDLATYESWKECVIYRRGIEESIQDYCDWVVANTRRTHLVWSEWGYDDVDSAKRFGWHVPIADPYKAFQWTRELFDRYGDRTVAAIFITAGLVMKYGDWTNAWAQTWGQ